MSSRLAVSTASLLYTDEMKIFVKGNPPASDDGDLGNSVVGVCRGERGGQLPTVRHEHLLGLTGMSHSPSMPRQKKGGREGGLIGVAETPFSRHRQKKIRISESGRSIIHP